MDKLTEIQKLLKYKFVKRGHNSQKYQKLYQ